VNAASITVFAGAGNKGATFVASKVNEEPGAADDVRKTPAIGIVELGMRDVVSITAVRGR
jgi:hypothetical protein